MNNSSVASSGESKTPPENGYFEPVYDGFLIAISVSVVSINVLVLTAFMRHRQLQTKTNTLLASLAFSDLLMGSLGIPLHIACNATFKDDLCLSASLIYRFVAVSTMFHIFAVTVERYISVIHPLNYINIVTGRRILRAIISIWATASFIALIQLSWVLPTGFVGINESKLTSGIIYNSFTAALCFALPFLVMTWIYCKMFLAIHRQVKEIKNLNFAGVQQFKPLRTELRAITIFSVMLGMFAGCWTTFYIGAFQEYLNFPFDIPEVWLSVFDFLRFSTSLLNPILYIFLKHDFREALVMFQCCKNATKRRPKLPSAIQATSLTAFDTKL